MNLIFAFVATATLVARALSRKSLTLDGILAAVLTAAVHAIHPWNLPFTLLLVFYGLGTAATKVKHDIKAKLTLSSDGTGGGEGPRNYVQVFANTIVASILLLLHAAQLYNFHLNTITTTTTPASPVFEPKQGACFDNASDDLLIVGIIANYASTLSDTLSSELGILAKSQPRLITSWKVTPKGTNGGITLAGTMAGAAGAAIIGVISVFMLPVCEGAEGSWGGSEKVWFVAYITFIGTAGSLLDSLLGALFQQSIIDVRTKKIVEAPNGAKVMVEPSTNSTRSANIRSSIGQAPQSTADAVPSHESSTIRNRQPLSTPPIVPERPNSRKVITGQKWGFLNNNHVNLLMAAMMSVIAMVMWGGMGKVGGIVAEQTKTVIRTIIKQEIINAVVGVILAPILG